MSLVDCSNVGYGILLAVQLFVVAEIALILALFVHEAPQSQSPHQARRHYRQVHADGGKKYAELDFPHIQVELFPSLD